MTVHQNVKTDQVTISFQLEKKDHNAMVEVALLETRSASSVYRQAVKNFLAKRDVKSGGTIVEYAMVTATVAWIGIIMLKLFVMWVYSIF